MKRSLLIAMLLVAVPAAALGGNERMTGKSVKFTVRIENVSTASTLKLSTGGTAPAPNSPGLWVVHTKPARLFKAGEYEMGWGLEAQAEDGDPAKLAEHCATHEGVAASGVFNTPVGDDQPGPALPGKAYEFSFTAQPGQRLSFTTMFGQSNDLFYAPDEKGIALFDGKGKPLHGDITSQVILWDAGTEVNQEPGAGPDQAPRQSAPNTGAGEHQKVGKVKDRFTYPKVAEVLRVTLTHDTGMASR